ncbi:MAG: nuclear transport factor 2 family protein [Steroidobacteraceae bacterium]
MSDLDDYDSLGAEDRAALTALCTEYCWRKDNFQAEKVADLFTDDGVWGLPPGHPSGTEVRGRKALVDAWTKRPKYCVSRTLISNLRFLPDGPDAARGWVTFCEFAAHRDDFRPANVLMVGDWVDTYRKGADGKWQFTSRNINILFGGMRVM